MCVGGNSVRMSLLVAQVRMYCTQPPSLQRTDSQSYHGKPKPMCEEAASSRSYPGKPKPVCVDTTRSAWAQHSAQAAVTHHPEAECAETRQAPAQCGMIQTAQKRQHNRKSSAAPSTCIISSPHQSQLRHGCITGNTAARPHIMGMTAVTVARHLLKLS